MIRKKMSKNAPCKLMRKERLKSIIQEDFQKEAAWGDFYNLGQQLLVCDAGYCTRTHRQGPDSLGLSSPRSGCLMHFF